MDEQEAYDRMVKHFSQPGAQLSARVTATGTRLCEYRQNSDPASPVRCAVGCLIPDELYDRKLDRLEYGTSIDDLCDAATEYGDPQAREVVDFLFGDAGLDTVLYGFLVEAQNAHDTSDDVGEFLSRLKVVAKQSGLTVQ